MWTRGTARRTSACGRGHGGVDGAAGKRPRLGEEEEAVGEELAWVIAAAAPEARLSPLSAGLTDSRTQIVKPSTRGNGKGWPVRAAQALSDRPPWA